MLNVKKQKISKKKQSKQKKEEKNKSNMNKIQNNNKKNKITDNHNNNNNNSDNKETLINNSNNIHYINEILYSNVKNKLNIELNDVKLYNITPDGNCCMRALSQFIYKTENEHIKLRNEIADF